MDKLPGGRPKRIEKLTASSPARDIIRQDTKKADEDRKASEEERVREEIKKGLNDNKEERKLDILKRLYNEKEVSVQSAIKNLDKSQREAFQSRLEELRNSTQDAEERASSSKESVFGIFKRDTRFEGQRDYINHLVTLTRMELEIAGLKTSTSRGEKTIEIDDPGGPVNPKRDTPSPSRGKEVVEEPDPGGPGDSKGEGHQTEEAEVHRDSDNQGESDFTRMTEEERSKYLDKVLEGSWEKGKGEDIGKRAETCINHIVDALRHMGDKKDPWENIGYEMGNEIKGKILDKVLEGSWEKGKGEYIVIRAKTCINHIVDALRHMGDEKDPWENIGYEKRNEIKGKILVKVLEGSLKGDNIDDMRVETCMNQVIDVLEYMGDKKDPWQNIGDEMGNEIKEKILDKALEDDIVISINTRIDYIMHFLVHMGDKYPWGNIREEKGNEIKGKILDEVYMKSWKEGKGKLFAERAEMCRETVRVAAIRLELVDTEMEKVMSDVNEDLKRKEKAIEEDRQRWRKEGLPGRGWSEKANYEQDTLSPSDILICDSITNAEGDRENIRQLYWSYGSRESLNIDASELEDSTYERMHPYLSELEAAENEFRQGVKEMCVLQYYKGSYSSSERASSEPSMQTEASLLTTTLTGIGSAEGGSLQYGGGLDSPRTSLLSPALDKYNAALKKAKEEHWFFVNAPHFLYEDISSEEDSAQ